MGVAIGVACHLEEGRFEVFSEREVGGLVDALRGATVVIGFNIKRFDYLVLSAARGEDFARTCRPTTCSRRSPPASASGWGWGISRPRRWGWESRPTA